MRVGASPSHPNERSKMSITYEEQRTETQKRIDAEVLERVKTGLAWLEETHGPGWEDKIDLDTLDLRDANHCVIGQVYGSFYEIFPSSLDDDEPVGLDAYALGFDLEKGIHMDGGRGWTLLQEAWEYVLRPRVTRG